jgi:hypothetical protein
MRRLKNLFQQVQHIGRAIDFKVHARIAHRHSPREQNLKSVEVESTNFLSEGFDEVVLSSVVCWTEPDKTI